MKPGFHQAAVAILARNVGDGCETILGHERDEGFRGESRVSTWEIRETYDPDASWLGCGIPHKGLGIGNTVVSPKDKFGGTKKIAVLESCPQMIFHGRLHFFQNGLRGPPSGSGCSEAGPHLHTHYITDGLENTAPATHRNWE
jgi:hypothetical protein